MSASPKTLFLHVGIQKTGSSFLQHMLRRNAEILDRQQIAFLHYPEDRISSGNGDRLLRALATSRGIGGALAGYFGRHARAIVSSELLYTTDLDWRGLFSSCKRQAVDVILLAFFRSPSGYLRGAYSQSVARHQCIEQFAEFVANFDVDRYAGPLQFMMRAAEEAGLPLTPRIMNYDECKTELFEHLLVACGVDPTTCLLEKTTVNPSLNADQVALHRLYNISYPNDFSQGFREFVQESLPFETSGPLRITPEIAAQVSEKFKDPLDQINAFISGAPIVEREETIASAGAGLTMDEPEIGKLMAYLATSSVSKSLTAYLVRIVQSCEDVQVDLTPEFPDFDPVHYLICNPDLVAAGANPYRHFRDHGAAEGRRYRLFPKRT